MLMYNTGHKNLLLTEIVVQERSFPCPDTKIIPDLVLVFLQVHSLAEGLLRKLTFTTLPDTMVTLSSCILNKNFTLTKHNILDIYITIFFIIFYSVNFFIIYIHHYIAHIHIMILRQSIVSYCHEASSWHFNFK